MTRVKSIVENNSRSFFLSSGNLISKCLFMIFPRICICQGDRFCSLWEYISHSRNSYLVHQHLTRKSMRIYSENWNDACAVGLGVWVEFLDVINEGTS